MVASIDDLFRRGFISQDAASRAGFGDQYAMNDEPRSKFAPQENLPDTIRPRPLIGRSAPQGAQTIIPPSSPNVQAAINRLKAWLPENERNGPNIVMRKNMQIMERGGSIAESLANHTLKTWEPHPNENGPMLEGPVIEHE